MALHVLLGLRPGLGGDDGDVAAGGGGVGEPCGEQGGVDAPAAMRRIGRGAGELGDSVAGVEARAAGDDAVEQRDVAGDAGCREVALGTLEDVAREVLVRRDALSVRVRKAGRDDGQPRVELVLAARADLDPQRDAYLVDGATEDVLERRRA